MPLHVSTTRIGYQGPDALDITRKSGTAGLVFAPSWGLLGPALEARRRAEAARAAGNPDEAERIETAAWDEYAPRYIEEMRRSYKANRDVWNELLGRTSAVLLCYCGSSLRCHRRLLAEILVKMGAEYVGEVKAGNPDVTQGLLQLGEAITAKGRSTDR